MRSHTIPFGKFKGKALELVDTSYLIWLSEGKIRKHGSLFEGIVRELKRREEKMLIEVKKLTNAISKAKPKDDNKDTTTTEKNNNIPPIKISNEEMNDIHTPFNVDGLSHDDLSF